MTYQLKLQRLQVLLRRKRELDKQWNKFSSNTGCPCDSPLGDSIYRMFDSYVATVGVLLGDNSAWIPWFIYDNNMGKAGLEVHWHDTKHKHHKLSVKTVKHLLQCINATTELVITPKEKNGHGS